MFQKLFALSFGFAALILVSQAARAAPQCGPRAAVPGHLGQTHGESRRAVGLAANNLVMEVFASSDSQSWTITVTTPQGQTCLIASGQGYEAMAGNLPARGDPA